MMIRKVLNKKKQQSNHLNLNMFIQNCLDSWFKSIIEDHCISPTQYGFKDDELSFDIFTNKEVSDEILSQKDFFSLKQIGLFERFETIYLQIQSNKETINEKTLIDITKLFLSYYHTGIPAAFKIVKSKEFDHSDDIKLLRDRINILEVKLVQNKGLDYLLNFAVTDNERYYIKSQYNEIVSFLMAATVLHSGIVERKDCVYDSIGEGVSSGLSFVPIIGSGAAAVTKRVFKYKVDQYKKKEYAHVMEFIKTRPIEDIATMITKELFYKLRTNLINGNLKTINQASKDITKEIYRTLRKTICCEENVDETIITATTRSFESWKMTKTASLKGLYRALDI